MSPTDQPVATSDKPLFPTSDSQAAKPSPVDAAGPAARDASAAAPASTPIGSPAEPAETSPVSDVVQRMVRGAHGTIDSLAERATTQAQRLDAGIGSARSMLTERSDELGAVTDEWANLARQIVRDHPLATLAAALAVGVVFARLTS